MSAIKAQTNRLASTSEKAVKSGAYIYPLKGITYFIGHRSLQTPLWRVALPTTLLSLGVLVVVFGTLYLPQVAVLTVMNGPVAFVNAALLCLSESSFLINTIARIWFLEDCLLEVFDATLIEKDLEGLVSQGREIEGKGTGKSSVQKLGKLITKPFGKFSVGALIEYIVLLPLNAIPIVGTAAFILLQGYKSGPRLHSRYFDLKKFSPQEKEAFVKEERGAYTAFGMASAVLGMIPFASIPIQFTNTVGAALWAANLEGKKDEDTIKANEVLDGAGTATREDENASLKKEL